MTTPFFTRCPTCNTTFQVTQRQLNTANGHVRCGACLAVFHARNAAVAQTASKTESSVTGHAGVIVRIKRTLPFLSKLDSRTTEKALEKRYNAFKTRLPHRQHFYSVFGITLLSLLLLFFITAKNTLSLIPLVRPAYLSFCAYAHCSVPMIHQPDQIATLELHIRQHPQKTHVLLVDTVMINQLPYPQAFPLLLLSFTDNDEKTVFQKTFQPREYIGGELSGATEIPAQQPVRLGMEIIDPGQEALNYTLTAIPDKVL